jgi:hypothetical protein
LIGDVTTALFAPTLRGHKIFDMMSSAMTSPQFGLFGLRYYYPFLGLQLVVDVGLMHCLGALSMEAIKALLYMSQHFAVAACVHIVGLGPLLLRDKWSAPAAVADVDGDDGDGDEHDAAAVVNDDSDADGDSDSDSDDSIHKGESAEDAVAVHALASAAQPGSGVASEVTNTEAAVLQVDDAGFAQRLLSVSAVLCFPLALSRCLDAAIGVVIAGVSVTMAK